MTSESLELAGELVEFATQHGWTVVRGPKENRKFAFVTLRREWGGEASEELRAFYAIDPDADDDQITHVQPNGVQVVLDPDSGDVRDVVTRSRISTDEELTEHNPGPRGKKRAMPPTDAAHTADDTSVPPTSDTDAAHPTNSAAHARAETHVPPESTVGGESAAHDELDVPPTEETIVEHFGIVPPADEAEVAQEALRHARDADENGNGTWSQQDTYAAVRHQQVNPNRNWSAVASPLTTAEILTKLGVNRKSNNLVEIVWLNSLSGTLDRAVVNGASEKNPPHITPSNFDPDEHGEDLRILHFLEHNGGFRSVAVARIKKIG